jgi:glycosyltransferase involved in cell wall biosynthesis
LALRFLQWLGAQRPSWRFSTLFLDGTGPLLDDFVALGSVLAADQPVIGLGQHQWLAGQVRQRRLRRAIAGLGKVDLAHVHCAGSMRVAPLLGGGPVLCHLHELSVGLDLHLDGTARRHLGRADRYVAVSDGVRDEFLSRYPVDPAQVDRQWGFVDTTALPEAVDRSAMGIDPDAFVVVSSGVRHWRKGPELFVRVAQAARALRPDIPWSFVWVGGQDVGGLHDLVTGSGLDDVVRFVPHQAEPLRWVGAADVFLLPAREDAFPLVCVEAAALARPIVTFDNGGAAELVRRGDCGAVVPFPDVAAMAQELIALADDPERARRWGGAAAAFASQELTLAVAGPRLLSTIESTLR